MFGHKVHSSKTSFVNYMFWIKILKKECAPQSGTEDIPGSSQREGSVLYKPPIQTLVKQQYSLPVSRTLEFHTQTP